MACRTGLAHKPCFDKLSTGLSVLLAESRSLSLSLSKDGRTRLAVVRQARHWVAGKRGPAHHPRPELLERWASSESLP
jgi:hypothetical protein